MTTEQQRRIRELFDAALDQPSELRREFLASACHGDLALQGEVERLLKANERSAGTLDTPVRQRFEPVESSIVPGSFIGPYRILRELKPKRKRKGNGFKEDDGEEKRKRSEKKPAHQS